MGIKKILLTGRPNVGKSCLFNNLSNNYATVSNYPGTTVGVTRGALKGFKKIKNQGGCHTGDKTEVNTEVETDSVEILDLPGMYHFVPITDEERVASNAILKSEDAILIHVVEGTKLPVHLPMTCLLRNTKKPFILVVNMIDEANAKGIEINFEALSAKLGVPVMPVSALNKQGIDELKSTIKSIIDSEIKFDSAKSSWPLHLWDGLDKATHEVILQHSLVSSVPAEIYAMMVLEGGNLPELVDKIDLKNLQIWKETFEKSVGMKAQVYFYELFRKESDEILKDNFKMGDKGFSFRENLSAAMIKPIYGIPILLLILYLGIYEFVGVFGAGTVVGFIEEDIFGVYINPFVTTFFENIISVDWLRKLFVGDYGLFTLGITYAFALVLPVVFFFFLIFSMIEDSGYFPRLALLIDKVFKVIGLNGRAVIPMVLGLGCDTMATITTRTLESKKERLLATFLLTLAIPCSAQLGLITGLLSGLGFIYWLSYVAVITSMFFGFGWVGKKIIKGDSSSFFMEMPPLRMPRLGNVFLKSFSRMKWYFIEVVPLFLIASVILWALDLSGGMDILHSGIKPLMSFIGLPESAAESFLIGFFRRDFGAAGLFKMVQEGTDSITPIQVFIGSVTLTLFVPCVAQFMIMWKERGPKAAMIIFVIITAIAFSAGGFLNFGINYARALLA